MKHKLKHNDPKVFGMLPADHGEIPKGEIKGELTACVSDPALTCSKLESILNSPFQNLDFDTTETLKKAQADLTCLVADNIALKEALQGAIDAAGRQKQLEMYLKDNVDELKRKITELENIKIEQSIELKKLNKDINFVTVAQKETCDLADTLKELKDKWMAEALSAKELLHKQQDELDKLHAEIVALHEKSELSEDTRSLLTRTYNLLATHDGCSRSGLRENVLLRDIKAAIGGK